MNNNMPIKNPTSQFSLYDFWVFMDAYNGFNVEKLAEKIETVFMENEKLLNKQSFLYVDVIKFRFENHNFEFEKMFISPSEFIKLRDRSLRRILFSNVKVNGIIHVFGGKMVGAFPRALENSVGSC